MFFGLEGHEVAVGIDQRRAHAARSYVNGQKQIARAHRIQILRYVAVESTPSVPCERHILATFIPRRFLFVFSAATVSALAVRFSFHFLGPVFRKG